MYVFVDCDVYKIYDLVRDLTPKHMCESAPRCSPFSATYRQNMRVRNRSSLRAVVSTLDKWSSLTSTINAADFMANKK